MYYCLQFDSVLRRICTFFQENRAFCHKSVKLGTVFDEHLKNILSYGDFFKLSCVAFDIFQNDRHTNSKMSMFCDWELYKTSLKPSDNNNQV